MAFIDTRKLPSGSRIESDVCVIGSGAAGLAIASHFLDRSRRVALLESGGMEVEPKIQRLCQGRVVGQSHAPLATCRLRLFGGTTNHWTAHVRRLDPIDFERRDWVPHSGWPFGPSELGRGYQRASQLLRIPERTFEVQEAREERLCFGSHRMNALVRYVVPESDRSLGSLLRDRVAKSRNVDTYLYGTVLEMELEESRKRVRQLRVGTLDGVRITARARTYVLAAGGIENPRILLLSSIGTGDGTRQERVGAFFANHPEAWCGYLQPCGGPLDPNLFAALVGPRDGLAVPLLRLSDRIQRRFELLNCWLQVAPGFDGDAAIALLRGSSLSPTKGVLDEVPGLADGEVANLALDMEELGRSGEHEPVRGGPAPTVAVRVIGEPSPNPSSGVRLGDELDAFGQRRAVLDWQLTERDSESACESFRVFAREVAAAGIGRARVLFPKAGFRSLRTVGSHHHMGTTRMSVDPREGVVDPNCRFHGIANLYVAGSSVFPTYGTANPTYSILALAFRLAEHLDAELSA